MRQRIDMKKIRARALDGLPESIDGVLPLPLPQDLPESDDVMFWLDLSS